MNFRPAVMGISREWCCIREKKKAQKPMGQWWSCWKDHHTRNANCDSCKLIKGPRTAVSL